MPNTITRSKKDRWFYWKCNIENCRQTKRYLNKSAMYIGSESHRELHKGKIKVEDQ